MSRFLHLAVRTSLFAAFALVLLKSAGWPEPNLFRRILFRSTSLFRRRLSHLVTVAFVVLLCQPCMQFEPARSLGGVR